MARIGSKINDVADNFIDTFKKADLLGLDTIELRWNNKGKQFFGTRKVNGFFEPKNVAPSNGNTGEEFSADAWKVCTAWFFPDDYGVCKSYIIDCEKNRELLETSFRTGWYTITDKRVRDEIKQSAIMKGKKTEVTPHQGMQIRKSAREIQADKHSKNLERRLEEMKEKQAMLEKELELTAGKKASYAEKKLTGVKITGREEKKQKLKGNGDKEWLQEP